MDKKRFMAALALAGIRQMEFAKQIGVSPSLVSRVLDGNATSGPVAKKIADFTEAAFKKHSKKAA